MIDGIGPTNDEFLNYLSWCEAQGIDPFDASDSIENNNDNEITNIDNKTIVLKKRKDD